MVVYDLKTMQVSEIKENTVVALGTFDGCHRGHASVLQNAFYKAKELGLKSVAYTLDTSSAKNQALIMTLEEKIKAIKKFGIDYIALEELENVQNLSGEEFVNTVLKDSLKTVFATCGFNYHFGRGAKCGVADLERFLKNSGGSVQISEKIVLDNTPVSSTLIRGFIENGEVERLLSVSAPYSIYAEVERGKGLGSRHGFATINQHMPAGKVIPKQGVYITECEIGEDVYPAITNVGVRPTTDGENARMNVETHIIGYTGDLYYSWLRVNFYKYLRDERKFDSIEELKRQIDKDKDKAISYFRGH